MKTKAQKEIEAGRAAVLTALRKDEGMTLEKVAALTSEDRKKIIRGEDDPSPEDVFNIIRWTALSMPEDQYSKAIRNALGIGMGMGMGNLTERRMRLLEQMDVSLRTLINYEDTGAELLAMALPLTNRKRDEVAELSVSDIAFQVLRLRETIDRAGVDADLPSKLAHIENRLEELWEHVFGQEEES